MMDVVVALMYAAVVLVSILLIALILVQPSKSEGLGSAFGGIGESAFGAHTMAHLSKVTIVLLCIFFALTLGLAVIAGHRAKGASGLKNSLLADSGKTAVEKKAAPAKKAPEKAEAKSAAKPAPAVKDAAKPVDKPSVKAPEKKAPEKKGK